MEKYCKLVLVACLGLLGISVEVRSQTPCSGFNVDTFVSSPGACGAECPAGTLSLPDFSGVCTFPNLECCVRPSGTGTVQCSAQDPTTSTTVPGNCAAVCPTGTLPLTDLNSVCLASGTQCCASPTGTGGGTGSTTGLECGIARANVNVNGVSGPIITSGFDSVFTLKERSARILGGTSVPSTATRHCWIAQIWVSTNNGQTSTFRAAGAIVNANYIITTASAMMPNPAQPQIMYSASQLRVRVGSTSASAVGLGLNAVSTITRFPGYRFVSLGYPAGDVALLRLSTPIDFMTSTTACGACLPNATTTTSVAGVSPQEPFLGERCNVAGFGSTSQGAATDGQLREVMVPVIPLGICDRVYRQALSRPAYATDATSMCAGGQQGKDTCTKDGGAPLACISPAAGRQFYVVAGLSSFGLGCGQSGIPSVYTNLANPTIRTWITTTAGATLPTPQQASLCPTTNGITSPITIQ